MSSNQVKCPNCGTSIDVQDILSHQLEDELKKKFDNQLAEEQKKIELSYNALNKAKEEFEQKKKNENELFQDKLNAKLKEEAKQLETKLTAKIQEEQSERINLIEKELQEKSEQVKELNRTKAEIEKIKREKEELKGSLEVENAKKLTQQLSEEKEKIRKAEEEKNELRVKELQKQLDDQKKLTEEMKRKQEQGSMQLQGEVQELALEAMLKETFPFDLIEEVGKGIRGADCIQTVRNNFGQACGKIIYESKRTQAFANDWIEKLKADMRAQNADIAVIVTQTMPKEMSQFGEKNGIWICTYNEVRALAHVLRNTILKVAAVTKSQENKGDKIQLLYDYLTGNEFSEQWKAIREGFLAMKHSIDTERSTMEKLWKAREKQLEKILLSASHISGSVEGISGNVDLKFLGDNTNE